MKKRKSNLDEAQEQKLLQLEHNGCWLAYWGLITAILVQSALNPGDLKSIAGEWIVFMALCLYMAVSCIKNGIWDRRSKPTPKSCLIGSLIAGAVMGIWQFVISYHHFNTLFGSIAAAVAVFLAVTGLCYAALIFSIKLYKNRVKKLDSQIEEE